MKKVIFLLGVAMFLTNLSLNAQGLTVQNAFKPKSNPSIGFGVDAEGNTNLSFKGQVAPNVYRRMDIFSNNASTLGNTYNKGFGLNFGIEKHTPLTDRLSFYRGVNVGAGVRFQHEILKTTAPNTIHIGEAVNKSYNAYVGFRLGFKYDVTSRFGLAVETNPQIGLRTNSAAGRIPVFPYVSNGGGMRVMATYKF